jgi:hypothetical protein
MTHLQTAISHLRALTDAYSSHVGLSASTVMVRLINDHKFAKRLEQGEDMRLSTYDKLLVKFADVWPDELPWPNAVPHPAKAGETHGEKAKADRRGNRRRAEGAAGQGRE